MIQTFATESMIRLLLTVIVIIGLAIIIFKYRATKNPTENSMDILKKRLERGEITEQDYEKAKQRQGKK